MPANFFRRSAAIVYDALLLFGVFLLLTAVAIALNDGEPVPAAWLRILYLGALYGFFTWFLLHGGQTLGMRAWHLHLVDDEGRAPTWRQVSVRFAAATLSWAVFGLGHLWILFDAKKLAWHDRLSKTYVVRAAPARRSSEAAPEQHERNH